MARGSARVGEKLDKVKESINLLFSRMDNLQLSQHQMQLKLHINSNAIEQVRRGHHVMAQKLESINLVVAKLAFFPRSGAMNGLEDFVQPGNPQVFDQRSHQFSAEYQVEDQGVYGYSETREFGSDYVNDMFSERHTEMVISDKEKLAWSGDVTWDEELQYDNPFLHEGLLKQLAQGDHFCVGVERELPDEPVVGLLQGNDFKISLLHQLAHGVEDQIQCKKLYPVLSESDGREVPIEASVVSDSAISEGLDELPEVDVVWDDEEGVTTAASANYVHNINYFLATMEEHAIADRELPLEHLDELLPQMGHDQEYGEAPLDFSAPVISHGQGQGTLSGGPDTNGTQSFITTTRTPHFDGQHVFGRAIQGMGVVRAMEHIFVDEADRPTDDIVIIDSGELPEGADAGVVNFFKDGDRYPDWLTDLNEKHVSVTGGSSFCSALDCSFVSSSQPVSRCYDFESAKWIRDCVIPISSCSSPVDWVGDNRTYCECHDEGSVRCA